jgi:hypothetical protein
MTPAAVDLRPNVDMVEEQGVIGSCTAMGSHKAVEIAYERRGVPVNLSALYVYYWAQVKGGFLAQDGAKLINAIDVLQERGVCTDALWPHTQANHKVKPPPECDIQAEQYRVVTGWEWYQHWYTMVDDMRTWLSKGIPIVVCYSVMEDLVRAGNECHNWREFTWDNTKGAFYGDHCSVVIGYDDAAQRVLVQNSWGRNWADGGFFGVPYSMVPKVFNDARALKLSIPYVNAGWVEEPIDQFNRMMDWAENKFSFPKDTTKDFGPYWYRKYWDTYVGLDRNRDEFVKLENGVYTDLGQRSYWLEKMNDH